MKKIFTILLLSGSLLMSGCSDWLLSKPQHYPKNTVFYSVNHSVIG